MNLRLTVHGRTIFRQLTLVVVYCLLQWFFHNIIMSVVTFFHFKLEHNLKIINEWIFDNGWEIVSLGKVFASYLFLKFILVASIQRKPFRELFLSGILFPTAEILVLLGGLIFFFIFAGGGQLEPLAKASFVRSVVISLGIMTFYMTDIFVLLGIQKIYPIREKYRLLIIPVISLVLFLFSKMIYPFAKGMDTLVLSNLILFQVLMGWKKYNWTLASLLCLFFVVPAAVFTGLDPVGGHEFSLFALSSEIGGVIYFIIVSLSVSYLFYKHKTDRKTILSRSS